MTSRAHAFTVATWLAQEAIHDLTGESGHSGPLRNDHIRAVAAALDEHRSERIGLSREGIQATIECHIADHKTQIAMSDAITALECDAQDAGYLYGLALGLVLVLRGER
jgi:hypothetical protein